MERLKLALKAGWYVLRGHTVVYRAVLSKDPVIFIPSDEKALIAETRIVDGDTGILVQLGDDLIDRIEPV